MTIVVVVYVAVVVVVVAECTRVSLDLSLASFFSVMQLY